MNKYILFLFSIVLFITSCCEQEPPGIIKPDGPKVADSSYIAPLEAKQERNVLIEELTGVRCSNCPRAADIIKGLEKNYPARIVAVGLHPAANDWTEPHFGKSKYDFGQEDADEIYNILETGPFPSASLSRIKGSDGMYYDRKKTAWETRIQPMLAESTPLNIKVESIYNADNNNCEVVVRTAFTENITEDLFLTIYVLEDDLIDYQVDGRLPSGQQYVSDYQHNHVFRKAVSGTLGSSLNFANKTAGMVLQKRIFFEPKIEGDNSWNLDNCQIVAFVHTNGSAKKVLHAQEISLR